MDIKVRTTPHNEQRYETVGDWVFQNAVPITTLNVTVSNMQNEDYEFLVGIHELVEAYLCKKRGISEEAVSNFDLAFERVRATSCREMLNTERKIPTVVITAEDVERYGEPGNCPVAPYNKEHMFATEIEKQIAAELGVDWEKYDEVVNSLRKEQEVKG